MRSLKAKQLLLKLNLNRVNSNQKSILFEVIWNNFYFYD